MSIEHSASQNLPFLNGAGEMAGMTRNFNWAETELGVPENWPRSLQTMVGVILRARMPMFLWWGDGLIQFYNDAYRPSLGTSGKHPKALGQHGADCWQEIWPVIKPLIDQVRSGGEATWQEDALIPIYRNQKMEDVYWTFSYSPVLDDNGEMGGVLVICTETTPKVKLFNALQDSAQELLRTRNAAEKQRDRMERFLLEAPAGICVLDGPDFVYGFINPIYQRIFPGRLLMGKTLINAVPELRGQPIIDVLKNVYTSGQTYEGHALLIPLPDITGVMEDHFFNFIYQPKFDLAGEVDGIMVFAFDVTEMVRTDKDLEKTKETLDAAIQAAELGIFGYDIASNVMEVNDKCRSIFGLPPETEVDFKRDFLALIHPEDMQRTLSLAERWESPDDNDEAYDVEFRIKAKDEQQVRWIRARGRVYFNQDHQPIRFTGALLDVTEQKNNEIRKNDFIGIVSHELKTPLTSLNAYIQLLSRTGIPEDSFASGLLGKMTVQLKKMTTLINGFLNVSRYEAGKIDLVKTHFITKDLLDEIVQELAMTTSIHEITVECSGVVETLADRDKIASVVSNLLSNAIKYSPEGKVIQISCVQTDNGQLFSVKDQGMGIRAGDLPKLFDRFFRIETDHTQNISGFGIGLYLCAEIIRLHGGKIWAESEIGVGSGFYFSLPLP
ncbi:MAG: ATP-binding protein [Bacteroidota bacterium]